MQPPMIMRLSLCVVTLMVCAIPFDAAGQPFRPAPPGGTEVPRALGSELRPGPAVPPPEVKNPYEGKAEAIAQGRNLYQAFNCGGCHFAGGGGIGPALMDEDWIYGGAPLNIFESIVLGRPNGMPAYANLLPDDQIWMIVAYVQSLSEAAAGGGSEAAEQAGQKMREGQQQGDRR